MNGNRRRIELIGPSGPQRIQQAAEQFAELAAAANDSGGIDAYLRGQTGRARAKLQQCLRDRDSFDTLAFLRMTASVLDFSDVRESESTLETSQAAQDVVALTLLAMGLPRLPLTGENNGQPDIGLAMRSAAVIVNAAGTRALLAGQQADLPLGGLAGKFLGYELSVRGRQYESIAAEINSELLEMPGPQTSIATELGFALSDVRAIRVGALELLNERFFRARDRLGEAAMSEVAPTEEDAELFRRDANLMLNECRLFGAVTATDVAERTGLDEATTDRVLSFFSAQRPGPEAADPVDEFIRGVGLIGPSCLHDGGEYLLLNGFLGEGELRREIERALLAASSPTSGKSWDKYNRARASYSESRAAKALTELFAGVEPKWRQQKFVGPVEIASAPDLSRSTRLPVDGCREYESDLLFVVDGVAVCVEVKAGSITARARGGDTIRLATDLQKTLTEANEQADRLGQLIRRNKGVWSHESEWIDLSSVEEIHSIVVMLDDMGPLSLSMNELAHQGVIGTEEVPWIVSLHDLLVLSRTFDHAAQFLEYLRRRRGRRLATMVSGVDELDMFMWFLGGGMYFDPDPQAVAERLPIERPVRSSEQRRFDDQAHVQLGTLTDPLDAWFYWTEERSRSEVPKPTRREEAWVETVLAFGESTRRPGWLRFGADLVGLSQSAQRRIGRDLAAQCRRACDGQVERTITTHGAGNAGSWLLCAAAIPIGTAAEHLEEYLDAKQYQTRSSRAMLLRYRPDSTLFDSYFSGRCETRSEQRDAEVAALPLLSLAATFERPTRPKRTKKRKRKRRKNHRR